MEIKNVTYRTVKYNPLYLKRIFADWTDAELRRERIECLEVASKIKAEMERRGIK